MQCRRSISITCIVKSGFNKSQRDIQRKKERILQLSSYLIDTGIHGIKPDKKS